MIRKFTNQGFMMIEIMVAATIIAVAILAVMGVAQKSIRLSSQTLHTAQAAFLLEEGAEAVRVLRDNEWTNITGLNPNSNYYLVFSSGTWNLSTTPNTTGIFTRKINLFQVNRDNSTNDISSTGTNDPGTRLFTITVSWLEGTTTATKTLSFYITDVFPDES